VLAATLHIYDTAIPTSDLTIEVKSELAVTCSVSIFKGQYLNDIFFQQDCTVH
jgi:hypothetical protein